MKLNKTKKTFITPPKTNKTLMSNAQVKKVTKAFAGIKVPKKGSKVSPLLPLGKALLATGLLNRKNTKGVKKMVKKLSGKPVPPGEYNTKVKKVSAVKNGVLTFQMGLAKKRKSKRVQPDTVPMTSTLDCAIINCGRDVRSKGFCSAHYQKFRSLQKTNRLPKSWLNAKPQSISDIVLPRGRAGAQAKRKALGEKHFTRPKRMTALLKKHGVPPRTIQPGDLIDLNEMRREFRSNEETTQQRLSAVLAGCALHKRCTKCIGPLSEKDIAANYRVCTHCFTDDYRSFVNLHASRLSQLPEPRPEVIHPTQLSN